MSYKLVFPNLHVITFNVTSIIKSTGVYQECNITTNHCRDFLTLVMLIMFWMKKTGHNISYGVASFI
jgi:hypothetical protein